LSPLFFDLVTDVLCQILERETFADYPWFKAYFGRWPSHHTHFFYVDGIFFKVDSHNFFLKVYSLTSSFDLFGSTMSVSL
jgi:hypothetical protein